MRKSTLLILVAALAVAAPAAAVTWCGDLGTVHLSFSPPDDLTPSLEAEPTQGLGLVVDVYAVLRALEPVAHQGERILAAGGFELELRIDGAPDAEVLLKEVPIRNIDVAKTKASAYCGLMPDVTLTEAGVTLVHWQVRIPGEEVRPVSFHLDGSALTSAKGVAEAEGCAAQAFWSGSLQNKQHGLLFGAAYVPAHLNPDGKPDTTPRHGKAAWRDVGVLEPVD